MISGPLMWKNCARAFVGDRAREQGLAGARRAVEQHALGRIDPEPLEQLGMAQRKLDHLAQRVDGVAHSAEVVVGDVGAALAVLRRYIREAARPSVLPSMWTMPLGTVVTTTSRSSWSAKAGALSICRTASGMSALTRWWPAVATVSPSTSGRPAKVRFKRVGRALQPDVGLGRREHHPGRRLGRRLAHLDEIARADPGIGALKAVEADDVDPFVLAVGADRARRGRALADDLDHVALVEAELLHQLVGQAGEAAAAVGRRQARDLHLARSSLRSIVSVSAIVSPGPRSHTACATVAQRGRFRLVRQYLIAPAIFRTTERGAKRVLAAPTLFIQPGTTTARLLVERRQARPRRPRPRPSRPGRTGRCRRSRRPRRTRSGSGRGKGS